jgi:hypothetical protein
MTEAVSLLSQPVVDELAGSIDKNMDRYLTGDFSDLEKGNGWKIESQIARWDPGIALRLDASGTPEAEVRNSLLVWRGFTGMSPALARDERLWARLCHVECLDFARKRWLKGGDSDANLVKIHFFANGLGGCRDDNAVGRLWWNAHVASLASPDDVELGLQRLLARANYRMQIIERSNTAFREPLVRGIVRLLGNEPWLNIDDEAIVDFMKEVNKRSGSFVFEALDDGGIDAHLRRCLDVARAANPRLDSEAA